MRSCVFGAGALQEGTHSFVFEGGGKRSRSTTLVIRFDNAAPTASITSPPNGGFAAGGSTLIAGTALPGGTVSVGGKELPRHEQQRFSGQGQAPAGQRALVIRFSHPQRSGYASDDASSQHGRLPRLGRARNKNFPPEFTNLEILNFN